MMPIGSVNLLSHLHTQFSSDPLPHLGHVSADKLGLNKEDLAKNPDKDVFDNPMIDDEDFHELMLMEKLEESKFGNFWPEDQLPKVAKELNSQLQKTELPRSISQLGHALVDGSRSLEGWVKQKQSAVDVIKNVRDLAHKCHDSLANTKPLSEECSEIRLPMQWYCLRRGATNQMLQFTKDMKRIRELASRASNEMHMHAGRPRDMAQQAEGDLLQLKYNMNKEAEKAAKKAANLAGDEATKKETRGKVGEINGMVAAKNEKNQEASLHDEAHSESPALLDTDSSPPAEPIKAGKVELESSSELESSGALRKNAVNSAAIIASCFVPSEASSRSRRYAQRERSALSTFL